MDVKQRKINTFRAIRECRIYQRKILNYAEYRNISAFLWNNVWNNKKRAAQHYLFTAPYREVYKGSVIKAHRDPRFQALPEWIPLMCIAKL